MAKLLSSLLRMHSTRVIVPIRIRTLQKRTQGLIDIFFLGLKRTPRLSQAPHYDHLSLPIGYRYDYLYTFFSIYYPFSKYMDYVTYGWVEVAYNCPCWHYMILPQIIDGCPELSKIGSISTRTSS
jgi:hypothetical protein